MCVVFLCIIHRLKGNIHNAHSMAGCLVLARARSRPRINATGIKWCASTTHLSWNSIFFDSSVEQVEKMMYGFEEFLTSYRGAVRFFGRKSIITISCTKKEDTEIKNRVCKLPDFSIKVNT